MKVATVTDLLRVADDLGVAAGTLFRTIKDDRGVNADAARNPHERR